MAHQEILQPTGERRESQTQFEVLRDCRHECVKVQCPWQFAKAENTAGPLRRLDRCPGVS